MEKKKTKKHSDLFLRVCRSLTPHPYTKRAQRHSSSNSKSKRSSSRLLKGRRPRMHARADAFCSMFLFDASVHVFLDLTQDYLTQDYLALPGRPYVVLRDFFSVHKIMTTRRTTSFTTSAFGRITPSLSSASASSTTTAATTAVSSPFTAGGTSPAHSLFTFCPRDGRPFQDGEFMCPWCNVSRDPAQFAADKAGSGGSLGEDTPKWRKLLYVQQPFPDNHVDGSFLEELQRNGTYDNHYVSLTTTTNGTS